MLLDSLEAFNCKRASNNSDSRSWKIPLLSNFSQPYNEGENDMTSQTEKLNIVNKQRTMTYKFIIKQMHLCLYYTGSAIKNNTCNTCKICNIWGIFIPWTNATIFGF